MLSFVGIKKDQLQKKGKEDPVRKKEILGIKRGLPMNGKLLLVNTLIF